MRYELDPEALKAAVDAVLNEPYAIGAPVDILPVPAAISSYIRDKVVNNLKNAIRAYLNATKGAL